MVSELQKRLRAALLPLVSTVSSVTTGSAVPTTPSSTSPASTTPPVRGVAVAVSGGGDSAMLAVHAAAEARALNLKLYFFHVHHGLDSQADAWAMHVERLGQALQVPVQVMPVHVSLAAGMGMEAAARHARYAAFTQAAAASGIQHILLAHHRDDQAETVLLRLLRGAGPTGLAAMAACATRDGVHYVRPWLEVPRALIQQFAHEYTATTGWTPVQDPSNQDPRYTRAALRTQLIPALNTRWPGWQSIVARHARLADETAQILNEVACTDLAGLAPDAAGTRFSLELWRNLTPARQALVLRYWLASQGARMPSEARLAQLLKQLRQLHSLGRDRHLTWNHDGHCVRVKHGYVCIEVIKS